MLTVMLESELAFTEHDALKLALEIKCSGTIMWLGAGEAIRTGNGIQGRFGV